MSDRLLLCTDLDRTLVPNGLQPESPMARALFTELAIKQGITLVYVSGRHKELIEEVIQHYALPKPHYVISDVGTKIYECHQEAWVKWPDWEKEIAPDWAGFSPMQIHELLIGIEGLRLQEWSKQNTHKLSYYVPPSIDSQALSQEIVTRLEEKSIRANIIWSMDEPAGIGLLDILPRKATKLHGICFLCDQLGFSLQETLFAGDSGNDMQVLTSPIPSVLVANASAEVRHEAVAEARHFGTGNSLYFAKGGVLDMNGNYSAGILEGIAYFYPQWLKDINFCREEGGVSE